tara:strand:- start:760 stop:1014 length:255 start_codon:yes stop_codon:yes gene_type:complete
MEVCSSTPDATAVAAAVGARATKRPLSGYFWFIHFARIAAKAKGPFNNKSFMSSCAAKWHELEPAEKSVRHSLSSLLPVPVAAS